LRSNPDFPGDKSPGYYRSIPSGQHFGLRSACDWAFSGFVQASGRLNITRVFPNLAQYRQRRFAVTETSRDRDCLAEGLGNALWGESFALWVKANFVIAIVLCGQQDDSNPNRSILPKSEIHFCAIKCTGPNRQPFQALAFMLAILSLNIEGSERVVLCKAATKLDGNVLKELSSA